MNAVDGAPTQVLGDQRRFDTFGQAHKPRQVLLREAIGRTDRQPNTMQADGVNRASALQRVHRSATIEKEVLTVDLEEPKFGFGLEDRLVMRLAKADADGRRR